MTRVLVAGVAPLPFEETLKSYGPGTRTWQIARGLAAAGHEVRVVAMRIRDAYADGSRGERSVHDGIEILWVDDHAFLNGDAVAKAVGAFLPQALVGATVYGSRALVASASETPFWADQFGHVMAEAQAKAALDGDNRVLSYFWNLIEPVMRRADKVSVVSERQRYAAIGELGALGRLTAESCGYEFVEVLPCAQDPRPEPEPTRGALRPATVPESAFVVLWSGTYNVWSDVDVLFEALERAMSDEPRIHFVSTGGEIPGHDETTYRRLRDRCSASTLRDRFHLLGWLPAPEVTRVWADADLGVLTERAIYEGELGSKNRIVHWMSFGLPVAYNRVGDLGALLDERGLGLIFPAGDAAALAAILVATARDPSTARARAAMARRYVEEHLSYSATVAPLCRWVEAPRRAPVGAGVVSPSASPADHAAPVQAAAAALDRVSPHTASWVRGLLRRLRTLRGR